MSRREIIVWVYLGRDWTCGSMHKYCGAFESLCKHFGGMWLPMATATRRWVRITVFHVPVVGCCDSLVHAGTPYLWYSRSIRKPNPYKCASKMNECRKLTYKHSAKYSACICTSTVFVQICTYICSCSLFRLCTCTLPLVILSPPCHFRAKVSSVLRTRMSIRSFRQRAFPHADCNSLH